MVRAAEYTTRMYWVQAKQGGPVLILQVGKWAIDRDQHIRGRPDPARGFIRRNDAT